MAEAQFHRILLKLSGEALAGSTGTGIDLPTVRRVATELADIKKNLSAGANCHRKWRRQSLARRISSKSRHGSC